MKQLMIIFYILACGLAHGQGYNHQWLIGYWPLPFDKGRFFFDTISYNLVSEQRKMTFWGTQGNISDKNGNFLMSSNGIWIANALNDTMLNGSGLNPNGITLNWMDGLPLTANNVIIPFPASNSNYILFHHTATQLSSNFIPALELFYSLVDITLDNGLGAVISKNNMVIQDTLNWGIGACKHANGRDWWIVMMKDSSSTVFKILLDSSGISSITAQNLNYIPLPHANSVQLTFSHDGKKFISNTFDNFTNKNSSIVIADFDRCTGNFSNIQTTQLINGDYLWGLAFSPSGKFAYACSNNYLFQIDTDNLTVDTVAVYDGFVSPGPNCCATTFFNMYLAANGKIYITSGNGVQHIHEMNYPDSAGIACDVVQHSIDLQNYLHLSAVPHHPNYYLGCDTTLGCPCLVPPVGVNEITNEFNLNIYPNPSNGNFNMIYLLPQNKEGKLGIIDVTGKVVYEMRLPQWSTLQQISLPNYISNGLYNCVITSNNKSVSKKIAVIKNQKQRN